jgi:hypothetical protein
MFALLMYDWRNPRHRARHRLFDTLVTFPRLAAQSATPGAYLRRVVEHKASERAWTLPRLTRW